MYKTQAIEDFLSKQECKIDLYHPSLEVQVNVLPGMEKIKTKGTPRWTDGSEVWSAFRIPFGGSGIDAEPHYEDQPIDWTFSKYVEAIGLTGWDWQNRQSLWVGFDFDSIVNHSQGLSDTELDELRHNVRKVPWITLRKSKSGKGYHLYVFLETPVPTQNHTEHAALAKAILSQLSGLLNFDFQSKVDTCGGVLWIWHREASIEKRSFSIIKQAEEKLKSIPSDWKEYLTLRRSRKRAPKRLAENADQFEDLLSRTKKVQLDSQHQALLTWFASKDQTAWWDAERSMLVCHTSALKQAHEELELKGIFETNATGRDAPYDHNCFCFPIRQGAWNVYRYGLGVDEHEYWARSPTGWTHCCYNKLPDLSSAARIYGGIRTKSGEFRFERFSDANKVLTLLGAYAETPKSFSNRNCTLAPGKAESEIIATVPYEEGDMPPSGWYLEGKQRNNRRWEIIVNSAIEAKYIEAPDEVIRHVTRPSGRPSWFVLSRGRWIEKSKDDVKSAMIALDYKNNEIDKMLGMAVLDDWEEVSIPFEVEYPGNRKWNMQSAQLAFEPRHGTHATWNRILEHLGSHLDVTNNDWCRSHHINTGAEYLTLWIASMLRHPFEPLPYLFFWSDEQNTGKSTIHEAIQLLLKDGIGYAKADLALVHPNGFNGELYNAVLAVVEEVDVSNRTALDRMKDWVTSPYIQIHIKRKDPFLTRNSTHWIQCSNNKNYCPIFPGDTRVTVGWVPELDYEIPKPELMNLLRSEAPYFLYKLMRMDIPPSNSRLRIPVLSSDIKSELEDINRSRVQDFIEECCEYTPGTVLHFDIFCSRFIQNLPVSEQTQWNRERVMREMPHGKYPRGTYNGTLHIGNLTIKGIDPKVISENVVRKTGRKLS